MAEETKPKAKLIKTRPAEKQVKQTQVSAAPASLPEKKKVVIIKKKPQVVVKTMAQEEPSEVAVQSQTKNMPSDAGLQDKAVKTAVNHEKKPDQEQVVQQKASNAEKPPVQKQAAEPVRSSSTAASSQKKVVKKVSNAANTTINMGPVIIRGDNLPPLFPQIQPKSGTSKPVGSVGGVSYGRDGQRISSRGNGYQHGNGNQHGNGGFQNRNGNGKFGLQGYQPKNNVFIKERDGAKSGFGGKPGFGSKPGVGGQRPAFKGKGGFSPVDSIPEGKNKRVFSSDKGRDHRKDKTQEEELDYKQFGRKKVSESNSAAVPKSIDIMASITVGDLAKKMNIKATEIIAKLFSMGQMVTINQSIDSDTATIIADEYGCSVHIVDLYEETVIAREADREEDLKLRAPIVTVMGHVDHGKTKLLDAIRSTNVVAGEFGGITQHIGAYKVTIPDKGDVVFLDTPGHAAFTMMRARGAQLTDIVVLVVAANDGVMPQTLEAIDHAKAADVPIIVAINKCDLPEAKPDRVMQQLSDKGLMPEEWGGDTMYCKISALKKEGIDNLLETILLQAEVMDLKANPNCPAEGKVVEARIDQGRGTVASVIIQKGTLHQGDYYVAGIYSGRVRAMYDDKGRKIKEAGPSTPVEVIGLSDIPSAGDPFQVCDDEKQARQVGTKRQELERLNQANKFRQASNWSELSQAMLEGDVQELNIIIKGDVQGSVEALQMALEKLSTPEIRVHVIRAAAGAIIEDDINLASASEHSALVIGFNVRPTPKAQMRADEEKIEIRKYNIIYNVVDDVKAAMEGMLSPERTEIDVGTAEVRQVFRVPKVGLVAGCYILTGSVKRNNFCRVVRDNIQLSKDLLRISSLKRFKDDVREVAAGFECGIGIENFQDLCEGDIIEFVEIKETARKLETSEGFI